MDDKFEDLSIDEINELYSDVVELGDDKIAYPDFCRYYNEYCPTRHCDNCIATASKVVCECNED